MRILLYSPKDMIAGALAFAAVSAIIANALFLQAGRHPSPMFGSVVVMPVLPDGRIVLIRQYRHAARRFLSELVAGRMDPGEGVRQAAARELIEETGYRAKRLRVFLDLFPTPGFLEERMYILLAEGVTAGKADPEEDERITAKAFTRAELETMIRRGVLRDAKSVAGLLYYFRFWA